MSSSSALHTFLEHGGRLTSPRSLESCLRCGLEPEELLPLSLEQFLPAKVDAVTREACQIQYSHFENLRLKNVKLVTEAFEGVCADVDEFGMESLMTHAHSLVMHGNDENADDIRNEAVDSTMVANEERRLERIKLRQEKEIASIIEMENKTMELQKANAVREAVENKRKREWEKERKKKRAAQVIMKREQRIL